MTRRGWLHHAAAGAALVAGGARRFVARLVPGVGGWPAAGRAAEPSSLAPTELDTLLAFGEVVVDEPARGAAARALLAEAIEDALRRDPARVASYRAAARLLERLAGRALADLDAADRRALLARHRLDARRIGDDESVTDDARFVRAGLLPELIGAYWRSAAGWAVVGYATFPGRCGDLVRYTRPGP
jgi:hypothetical protein